MNDVLKMMLDKRSWFSFTPTLIINVIKEED